MIDPTLRLLFVLALSLAPASAFAQDAPPPRPAAIQQLYDCRAITDAAARLACFDRTVAAVETAEGARDIRIVDRAQVRAARRGLFGLSLSGLNIFGSNDTAAPGAAPEADAVEEIEATLSEVTRDGLGKLVLILDNGQRWSQTDGAIGRSPRAGQAVRIRRGALGSFIANVADRPGIRVRRDR